MQHFNLQHLALLIFLVLPVVIVNSVLELNKNSEKNILPNNSHTSDQDGVLLANDPNLEFLSDHELNQHTLIVGTTGSGKTTTLLNFVISAATRNIPLIFLDGKGSIDLIDQLAQIAAKHQRKFKVFTLRPRAGLANLAGYNPFASGNATEWKNRIMTLFAAVEGKGQEHFSLGEQNYINFVANILAKLNRKVDLRVFLGFLENPEKLLAIAHETMPELGKKIAKLQQDSELNTLIGDVVKLLELFIYSDYGYLFNTLDMENVIILRESIVNKEIVLFQFDASTYPEDSKKVAKMVISDINSVFASFNHSTKCYCIFDEFASYASSNLAETISLHRSNGMHAVIGTQSIETVKLKSNETKRIAEELIACCNTYIIHALNHYQDATIMANIMGWQKEPDISHTISKAELNSSDKISQHIKMIDTHKISIDTLMELKTGDAIIYRKVAGILPHKVKIQRLQA
jgi:type IV secretory pathway VirB4 component